MEVDTGIEKAPHLRARLLVYAAFLAAALQSAERAQDFLGFAGRDIVDPHRAVGLEEHLLEAETVHLD